jgi:ABC-type lipoprotein release transport system permease subunit
MIAIGALTFLLAMNAGWLLDARENFILTFTAHVQVHAKGFEESQQIQDHMAEPERVTDLLSGDPAIAAWTRRIRISGLASVAEANTSALVVAVEPERERDVSRLSSFVAAGAWLEPGDRRGLLLGATLVENLGVSLGDKVVLTAQTPAGDISSEVFRLRGILRAGAPDVDRALALVPLEVAQGWLELGAGVTDVVIRAARHEDADGIRDRLAQGLDGDDYEAMRWMDIDPMIQQWLEFSDTYTFFFLLPVIAVVVAQIINTMLMAIYERVREFGLMEALGTRKGQLFTMVLWESLILVAVGGSLGYASGALAVFHFAETGIDLSGFADAITFVYMNPILHPVVTVKASLTILATALLTAVVAGIYPAWKATRLDPVEAMREL